MASSGNGSAAHVSGELFKVMAGVELVHVPYRGSLFPDLFSGQVQVTFFPMPGVIGFIRTGNLRALAVTTATRSNVLPPSRRWENLSPDTKLAYGTDRLTQEHSQ